MSASVIIPTYRRNEDLLRCLHSLRRQDVPDFEIVVVDNDHQGSARDVVAAMADLPNPNVVYMVEPRQGLHFARHVGALAATFDLLLFTDDDATPCPSWVSAYDRLFAKHPEVAAAGGPVTPAWEAPPPGWLEGMMSHNVREFGILSLMQPFDDFRMDEECYFFGVNLAIRKRVLVELGGFNPDSFGELWLGDGETGLLHKLRRRRMNIAYLPDAAVEHHIPVQRMRPGYILDRARNQGAADAYTKFHPNVPNRWSLARMFLFAALYASGLAAVVYARHRSAIDTKAMGRKSLVAYRAAYAMYIWSLLTDADRVRLVEKTDWLTVD